MKPRYRVAATADGIVKSVREVATAAAPKFRATNLAGSSMSGGFEGAQRQRRMFSFRPSEASINSLLMFSGQTLRARARYLVRNNPYARKAQRVFVTNLIGTGIRPIPLAKSAKVKDAITSLFTDWEQEADSDGLVDFNGLQELVGNALFEAGECFVRFRPRYTRDALTVPLQLQIMESEFCPYELNFVTATGNVVRSGVEFNPIGQRVAYHFWRTHPGEYALPLVQTGLTRVPASDVLHIFKPTRPGQVRGVSWLCAAIVKAWFLDQYDDAELDRKKTAALFAGFITRPNVNDDNAPLAQQDQPSVGIADATQNAPEEVIAGLTPGMMQVLGEGEAITFSEPADVGGNFEAFQYRALLALAAGMDASYAHMTGDYSKANYSSMRAAQLDTRAAVKQLQRTCMMFQFCRPAYQRFVSDAVVSGALDVKPSVFAAKRRDFVRVEWVPPRVEWVDPQKDMAAEETAMRNGVQSRESLVLSRGRTLAEMDAAIARSNASADAHGLVLDSDARRTNTRGTAPPPVATAPAPETSGEEREDDTETTDEQAAA